MDLEHDRMGDHRRVRIFGSGICSSLYPLLAGHINDLEIIVQAVALRFFPERIMETLQ
jgi:hypothetical protein